MPGFKLAFQTSRQYGKTHNFDESYVFFFDVMFVCMRMKNAQRILLTMVEGRTNYAKEITSLIRETYGDKIRIYDTAIPRSVRAAECSAHGESIFRHDPKGKVADAYRSLTVEVIKDDTRRRKRALEPVL